MGRAIRSQPRPGRSADRLARTVRVREVGGSNPLAPTPLCASHSRRPHGYLKSPNHAASAYIDASTSRALWRYLTSRPDGIRLDPPSQGGVIPAGDYLLQTHCTIKPRPGKEPVRQRDGQCACDDLPVGAVLHPAHPAGLLGQRRRCDGHGGAQGCPERSRRVGAVDVVEGAVHAGGNRLAEPRRSPLGSLKR